MTPDAHSSPFHPDDPAFLSQANFRAIMNALARPGTGETLQAQGTTLPEALPVGLALVALTLCDHDTPIWLAPRLAASAEIPEWLGFRTGAPLVAGMRDAEFALADEGECLDDFSRFAQGSQEYPDRSATVILNCAGFEEGPPLLLRGPGIRTSVRISPAGLPENFVPLWRQNRAQFPRGIDLILTCGTSVIGLPRSIQIEPLED